MLNKQQLAQVLIVKLQHQHPGYKFMLDSNLLPQNPLIQIHIFNETRKILSCSVEKLYQSYLKAPQDLDLLCEPTLSMVKECLSNEHDENAFLLPLVITQDRLEEIELNYQKKHLVSDTSNSNIPSLPLIANLSIIFVLHSETRFSYLTAEQLKKDYPNQNLQDLYALALANLALLIPKIKLEKSPVFEATLKLDNNYELSMLLIFEWWKHLLPFSSPPAIAIASRDVIIIADTAQDKQITALNKFLGTMNDNETPALVNRLLTIETNTLKFLDIKQ